MDDYDIWALKYKMGRLKDTVRKLKTQLTNVRKECRALADKLAKAEADRDVARARLEELDYRLDYRPDY